MEQHLIDKIRGAEPIRDLSEGLELEKQGKVVEAAAFYERMGATDRLNEILVRNADTNPGEGNLYYLRKYYLRLTDAEIHRNPTLMSGMSMLYSLMMDEEKSEYWYEELRKYSKLGIGKIRKEAKFYMAYLDLALPHRGSVDAKRVIQSMPSFFGKLGFKIPEFSVTSEIPSLMNGGKDFCDWAINDEEVARSMGKVTEFTLGKYGRGLVDLAMGESYYEKGKDELEVLSRLSKALVKIQNGGKKEMEFAVLGVQVRLMLRRGSDQQARAVIRHFIASLPIGITGLLRKNAEAMLARIALYEGHLDEVREWMQTAPDENADFYIMVRYQYLTKVRAYLAFGLYHEAYMLLEKLIYYADRYQRNYIQMEARILMAITKKHLHREDPVLIEEAFRRAEHYGFVRVIGNEGAAVMPMVEQYRQKVEQTGCADLKWINHVASECNMMTNLFPKYLQRPDI